MTKLPHVRTDQLTNWSGHDKNHRIIHTVAAGDFVIRRAFDAPRDLVFKALTEPQRMLQWWGPKGCSVIAANMGLRPGGGNHYGLNTPDGGSMWGKRVYREIVASERLVLINSFSDEAGNLSRHPLSPTWPLELQSTIALMKSSERHPAHDPLGVVAVGNAGRTPDL